MKKLNNELIRNADLVIKDGKVIKSRHDYSLIIVDNKIITKEKQ